MSILRQKSFKFCTPLENSTTRITITTSLPQSHEFNKDLGLSSKSQPDYPDEKATSLPIYLELSCQHQQQQLLATESSRLGQGSLKKWTEHSQELYLFILHTRGVPITPWGWMGVDFLDHNLLLSQKVHIKTFLMREQSSEKAKL